VSSAKKQEAKGMQVCRYVGVVKLQERRRGGEQERIMFIFFYGCLMTETRRARRHNKKVKVKVTVRKVRRVLGFAWLCLQGCDAANQTFKPLTGQAQGLPRLKMAAETTLSRLPRIASSALHHHHHNSSSILSIPFHWNPKRHGIMIVRV
jgi:hypothetical protein